MVEIRTFAGDPAEMASFTTAMWRKSYEGRMPMPLWQPDFLEWELGGADGDDRHYLVAAYDGSRLVGFLPAKAQLYRVNGKLVQGTMGSYLSVDPEYRRQRVAHQMHEEQQRRHRERGAAINMGYVYLGAAVAQGKKFWLNQPSGAAIVAKTGHFVRLLNHRAVAKFEFSRIAAFSARAYGLVQGPPRPPRDASNIRPYAPADLADCLRLVQDASATADFRYEWDERSLARQLQFKNVPRTLVATENGRVAGLINYCRLDFQGRDILRGGVIDLAAFGTLSGSQRSNLMRAALRQMVDEKLDVAMLLRNTGLPLGTIYGTGFAWKPADHYYIGLIMEPGYPLGPARRLHVHWR